MGADAARARRNGRARCGWLAAVTVLVGCAFAASSAAADDFTWSGAGAAGNWSDQSNWTAGVAPGGTAGTLTFPALTSGGCTADPPASACYQGSDDLTGLTADAISIDDGAGYSVAGDAITLGSGGITASPSASDPALAEPSSTFGVPLTLAAPQAWSIGDGSPTTTNELFVDGPVTGASAATLGIALADQASLSLANVEVGPVTVTGDGTISDSFVKLAQVDAGGASVPATLNATDGSPVTLTNGATLLSGDGAVGPLTATATDATTGGAVQVGDIDQPGTLTVDGDLSLDAQSALLSFINQPGTTAGSDYSQLQVDGNVNLANATLVLSDGELPGSTACEQLTVGDVDTLLSATGAVNGTLMGRVAGVSVPILDGTTIPLDCPGSGGSAPTATINYTAHSVTAAIETAGTPGTPTTTALAASPARLVTNQPVTLTGTVTATSDASPGTITFINAGKPIPGCDAQALIGSGNSYSATCQTTLAASPAPKVTAAFDPANGSPVAPSVSPTAALTVAPAPTTTSVAVSATTVGPNQPLGLTATVAPSLPGAAAPTGSVEFLVNGVPIPAGSNGAPCVGLPVSAASGTSTAQCDVQFSGGNGDLPETITAIYSGDGNFAGSTSTPQAATYLSGTPLPTAGAPDKPATVAATRGAGRAEFGDPSVTATVADVVVACKGSTGQRCTVSLKLTTHERTTAGRLVAATAATTRKTASRVVVVGRRTVTIRAGLGETVHVSLNAAGKHALAVLGSLPTTLTVVQTSSGSLAQQSTHHLTFTKTKRR